MEIARLVLGVVLLAVTGVLTIQLWRGQWLFLVTKPQVEKKGTFYPEGTHKSGQRVAWVMVACFAVIATLLAFEMARMTGNDLFAQVATLLNNIALLAYCVILVWTVIAAGRGKDFRSRFADGNYRMLLLLLASCIVMTVVGLLFV